MSEMLLNGIPFDAYLEKYKIFEKTRRFMMEYLKNWYDDNPEDFQKEMWADYRTVAETYQFKRKIAAFEKNYMTICMTRPCSALRSVWTSMMRRVVLWQFIPQFLTLTVTALMICCADDDKMMLPRGITGFWGADTAPPPHLDEKAFRQMCCSIAL